MAGDLRRQGASTVPGEQAFMLHDTYGFPIDLTLEMAGEQGLQVDETGFRRLMAEQRQRAKQDTAQRKSGLADLAVYRGLLEQGGTSTFTGYSQVSGEGIVRGLAVDGSAAHSAAEGADIELTLDRTPFYAEAGGQLADHGRLTLGDGSVVEIYDAQRPVADLIVHRGRVLNGQVTVGDDVIAAVDIERRKAISRAHTATHLVHAAIRRAIGDEATQAGSQNDAGRFRFDFSSPAAVPASVLADVEAEVNDVLLADLDVRAFVTSQDEARRLGALALFGEKYGDAVRVVEVGDYARELCGGTHATRSAQLGMVKLLTEASIGAGKRRIEGLVGADAFSHLAREHLLVSQLTGTMLNVGPDELVDRVGAASSRGRGSWRRSWSGTRAAAVLAGGSELAESAIDSQGVLVVVPPGPGRRRRRRPAAVGPRRARPPRRRAARSRRGGLRHRWPGDPRDRHQRPGPRAWPAGGSAGSRRVDRARWRGRWARRPCPGRRYGPVGARPRAPRPSRGGRSARHTWSMTRRWWGRR